jgi:uncharacterized membrane protein YeiH
MIAGIRDAMLFQALYIVAIIAEAMTAALAAGRRAMDWVGVCLLGCVTALGGGSARDVLLGHYPLSWVAHPYYLALTAGAALMTIAIARIMHHLRRLFLVLDAIGLVVFTVVGCNVALDLDLPFLVVIVSGMITGCVGGVLRDVLCNDVPLLFRSELYARVSVVASALYVGGLAAGFPHDPVMIVAMAAGLAVRLLAIRYGWNMPRFVYTRDLH